MDAISDFFQPIEIEKSGTTDNQSAVLGNVLEIYKNEGDFPDWEKADIAIIGVEEDRKSINNEGCGLSANEVRKFLYQLYLAGYEVKIADLGNIKQGFEVSDSYYAIRNVLSALIKKGVLPVIIGGSQDLTYANYLAYENLEQVVNIVSVDPTFDIGDVDQELDAGSYLSKIILHQPNFLFNYSNIGYQTYFTDQKMTDLMDKLYFDAYRLGQVKSNLEEVEPIVRNADILSFDMSSIRQSDAPGNANASPNGFYGEEACQIVRYAGMSDKLSSIGFYEYNPKFDNRGQTAHLLAQMIWYFIDGFYGRKNDFPFGDTSEYLKYRVSIKDHKHEILFYKSNKSDRWWMEVPYPPNKKIAYDRHHLVPCSYSDYQIACREEMPDRWWQTFQKLS